MWAGILSMNFTFWIVKRCHKCSKEQVSSLIGLRTTSLNAWTQNLSLNEGGTGLCDAGSRKRILSSPSSNRKLAWQNSDYVKRVSSLLSSLAPAILSALITTGPLPHLPPWKDSMLQNYCFCKSQSKLPSTSLSI